ncbi:hypothetical protein HELRODRAFT_103151 [Helobdella robusta]|uniref:Inhibitor of growth protein n=1 Tax=Helobdella robusta TaxID=6412 RepID=T1EDE4_HELRO|nr:hypothetical protein HELRODRAFT_103151 [Helobdella robusta]ESN94013.1 hypothetical protein HELRODRAFT_103151 [Helobdella robusta]
MLNSQTFNDALAAVSFLENYLDNMDYLPSEVQRHITIFREIEYQCKEVMTKLLVEGETYKSSSDVLIKKQAINQIKKLLIRQKDLGDQKLEILSTIYELVENNSRSLEDSMANLESVQGLPSHVKNEEKSFFPSVAPSASMATSSAGCSSHQKSAADNNNFNTTHNTNNSTNNNSSSSNNSHATTLSTRASTSSNFKPDDKQDNGKTKRHRQAKRSANHESYASAMKEEEKRDEEEKSRKKKTRREKMDKSSLMMAANNSHLVKIIGNIDPNEPLYCLCREVSYGEMIGCDNESCEVEWFHFHCVNLTHKPKGKWFCPSCRGDRQSVLNPELLEQRKAKKNAVMAIAAAAASNNNATSD